MGVHAGDVEGSQCFQGSEVRFCVVVGACLVVLVGCFFGRPGNFRVLGLVCGLVLVGRIPNVRL